MSAAAEYWPPRIRAMTEADLDAVWEIERRTYEFPWSRGIFLDCLRVPYICQVYEEHEQVIGYAVMSLAADEAHLLNLCLAATARGRGLGRRMLSHLTLQAVNERARVLFLEVRPSNAGALRLYHDIGFRRVGVRRDYYQAASGREDALVLALNLQGLTAPGPGGTRSC